MEKKHDKKAKPAAGKTPKGMKVDKAVKKFRKLEGKLWTREYLLKIAEFDGATIAPGQRCRRPCRRHGHPCRRAP